MSEQRAPLRQVGAIWKPREGSKAKGSGVVTINGLRQRFMIVENDRKEAGSRDPDYKLLSGDEPEVDPYAREADKKQAPVKADQFHVSDDDVPF